MSLSNIDKQIITKTQQYVNLLKRGEIDPRQSDQALLEVVGHYSDYYDDDDFWKWEVSVLGVLAHELSKILGTFPVVILDYNRASFRISYHTHQGSPWKTKKEGEYGFDTEKRPVNRPRSPHRIEDRFIVSLANKKIGQAAVEDHVVVLPIIADYNNRSVFETAVIALFPMAGAFAFRHRVSIIGRHMRREFDRAILERDDFENEITDTDPLEKWIVKKTPGLQFPHGDYSTEAIALASSETVNLITLLAERFQK